MQHNKSDFLQQDWSSSSFGLFMGLLSLVTLIITLILYFALVNQEEYRRDEFVLFKYFIIQFNLINQYWYLLLLNLFCKTKQDKKFDFTPFIRTLIIKKCNKVPTYNLRDTMFILFLTLMIHLLKIYYQTSSWYGVSITKYVWSSQRNY